MRTLLLALFLFTLFPAAAPAQQPEPPTAEEQLRRRVEALSRTGRTEEAIQMLETRREQGDLSEALVRRLVRLYRDAGRWEDVEALLLELEPDESRMDFGGLRQLADARFRLGREEEAEETLERAIALDPYDASRVAVVANIYAQWGDLDRAIQVLIEARERLDSPTEFAQSLSRHY
jgi:tetratricopeptide (TPR) repeat protein